MSEVAGEVENKSTSVVTALFPRARTFVNADDVTENTGWGL